MTTEVLDKPKIKPYRELVDGSKPGKKKLAVNFHRGQWRMMQSKARFILMLAGSQGGKTCCGAEWLLREIKDKGAGDYLAVTATFPLLKLKMLPEVLSLFRDIMQLGEYKESDKVFVFHDGKTRLIFGSATNPESIESATAKAAWLDEAGQKQFRYESWEAIQRRLAIHKGRALFTTTPYSWGWLKGQIYDRAMSDDPDYDIIQFDSLANPAYPVEEYNRLRDTLPPWRFAMFCKGQFEKPAGMIYDAFDELLHKVKRFPIPKEWQRVTGHDFGGANMAAVWYAIDPGPSQALYCYRSYLRGGLSVAGHVEEWKRLSEGENIILRVGGAKSEDSWREEFRAAGWPIAEPTVSDVETGINRVYAMHKTNRLFVFDDLYDYLDQKLSYSRELDDMYNPTEKIANKEDYHIMDAERGILSWFLPEGRVVHGKPKIKRYGAPVQRSGPQRKSY